MQLFQTGFFFPISSSVPTTDFSWVLVSQRIMFYYKCSPVINVRRSNKSNIF